jgi:hypothetical protein
VATICPVWAICPTIGIALITFISPLSTHFVGNDFTGINIKGDIFTVIECGTYDVNSRRALYAEVKNNQDSNHKL